MSNETRSLFPHNIVSISHEIASKRGKLMNRFECAIRETTKFSVDVYNALGDISVAEAEQGIIDFFTDQMRKRT